MTQQVYILKAVTSVDFQESDIIGVGTTREAVEKWFSSIIKNKWEKMNSDGKEFYKSLEAYQNSWYTEVWSFNLVQ